MRLVALYMRYTLSPFTMYKSAVASRIPVIYILCQQKKTAIYLQLRGMRKLPEIGDDLEIIS